MIDFTGDLVFMLQDCGATVAFGRQRTRGLLETVDEQLFEDARVYGVRYTLTIATGSLADVARDSEITVAGVAHTVMAPPQRIGDGALTRLLLGGA